MRKSIILLHANILKFIDGHWSLVVVADFPLNPAIQSVALIHPCPFGWRNVYSLIRCDARRRLIYQIPKFRSSLSFSLLLSLLPEISIQRNSSQNVVLPATLFSRCIGATTSYNEFTCDTVSLVELPILPVHYSTSCAQCCWWRFIYLVALKT